MENESKEKIRLGELGGLGKIKFMNQTEIKIVENNAN